MTYPLEIYPRTPSAENGILRYYIAVNDPFTSANISISISNTDNYTVSFEDSSGNVSDKFNSANTTIEGIAPGDLPLYDVVVRRIAGTTGEPFTITLQSDLPAGGGATLTANHTMNFAVQPTIILSSSTESSPSTTTTATVSITATNFANGSTATVQVDPPEFIVALVDGVGANRPNTSLTAGVLQISNISEGEFDVYRLLITRPPGVTSGGATVTMEIGSVQATAQVEFADIISPPSATDLQRGNTSTAGLLLLTSAAVLCAVSMTQKLNRGIFFISLMTAFTGIVFLV